jgi:hypothetical protein
VNAYELRKHLAAAHDLPLSGLPYPQLVMIHDQQHLVVQGHYHDDPPQGDG